MSTTNSTNMPLDTAKMHIHAKNASNFLKNLANPNRLILLCHLSKNEMNVHDLEIASGIQQPTLSQQLGVLREQHLVSTRREGKQIYYQLANAHVLQMLMLLYGQFCNQ